MSGHDLELFEQSHRLTEKTDARPETIDRIADNFALFGAKKRAAALKEVDAELRDEIDSGPHSLRRRVQLMVLRRRMGGIHQSLRKARR